MGQSSGSTIEKKPHTIRRMFDQISRRYDLLNRLMTFGLDQITRKQAAKIFCKDILPNVRVLDAGCGTGDLSIQISGIRPDLKIFACDFSLGMVNLAVKKTNGMQVDYVIADAQFLPFRPDAFQGVISGFLLRNVADIRRVLSEFRRVLQAGCPAVTLDTIPPDFKKGSFPVIFYYKVWIPRLGQVLTGNQNAYRYLIDSTTGFLQPAALVKIMEQCGFMTARWSLHALNTLALYITINKNKNPKNNNTIENQDS